MKFWDKYKLAFNKQYDERGIYLKEWIIKNPMASLCAILIIFFLFGMAIYNAITYIPPVPDTTPSMTIYQFFSAVQTVQYPWTVWVIFLLFLWLTKW